MATVYDKVEWHYPEGRSCPDPESAKKHLQAIVAWLHDRGLLSDLGKEVFAFGVDSDFSLTSDMVTEHGRRLLDRHYRRWLNSLSYDKEVDLSFWDKLLDEDVLGG